MSRMRKIFIGVVAIGWGNPVTFAGTWPDSDSIGAASKFVAQLPDPRGYEALGWIIAALAAIIVIIGGVFAAVIGGFTIVEKIRGTHRVHATTKAADDGPGRVEFDLHKRSLEELRSERKEDVNEMKASLREISAKLEIFSGDQYKARGRMHRRVNRMENAMHFWAGKLAGQGDEDAKRLQAILDASDEEESA